MTRSQMYSEINIAANEWQISTVAGVIGSHGEDVFSRGPFVRCEKGEVESRLATSGPSRGFEELKKD